VAALVAGLFVVGAPAFADTDDPSNNNTASGSNEQHQECAADGTCTWVYDNDVKCGEGNDVPTPIGTATISANGDPSSGGELEACTDDGSALQGRVIASGSTDGGFVAADGDQDNSQEQAQGWARVDVGPSGPSVSCGSTSGNLDAVNPGPGDDSSQCG
jgi:hypothetical protein